MQKTISSRDKILCAKYRKGHFEGVLAVVNRFMQKIKANKLLKSLNEEDFNKFKEFNLNSKKK